jgi:hypothetical protein
MIVNDIRPIMKAAAPGVPDTWDNLYQFFLNRVRDNLHVVLCFRWGQAAGQQADGVEVGLDLSGPGAFLAMWTLGA